MIQRDEFNKVCDSAVAILYAMTLVSSLLARTHSQQLPGTAAQRRSAERAESVGQATGLAKHWWLSANVCSCTVQFKSLASAVIS